MNETINIVRLRQPDEFDDTLRGVLQSAMRRLLAQAVEMEAEAFLAARWLRCARNFVADSFPTVAINSVKAPAGLDLGAITPEEIARSILAEVTTVRRCGQRHSAQSETAKA